MGIGEWENREPDSQVAKLDGDTRSSVTSLGAFLSRVLTESIKFTNGILPLPPEPGQNTIGILNRKLFLPVPNVRLSQCQPAAG